MYMNIWILLFLLTIGYCSFFCFQKEFFEDKPSDNILKKNGTKYNIVDVNRAVKSITQYFLNKDISIQVIKVLSIVNTPGEMELNLMLYDPESNIIKGYVIICNMPMSSKKEASIKTIKSFSDNETQESIFSNDKKMNYQTLNILEGKFT